MSANLKLRVEGLECGGCALDLETILLSMDGIIKARANCREEKVTIEYDPQEIDEEKILSAIRKTGLMVTVRQNDDRI